MFLRRIEVIVGGVKINYPEMDIDFTIDFDDEPEVNRGQLTLYNLSQDTSQKIKVAKQAVINAGYEGDVGTVMVGRIDEVRGEWSGTDSPLILELTDIPEPFNQIVSKTYKDKIRASQVIRDLISSYGLRIGKLNLPVDVQYSGGRILNSSLEGIIRELAKDCRAKLHVANGAIFLRPKRDGDRLAVVLSSDSGLIGTPTRMDEDGQEGYNVACLLNHRIRADSIIKLQSREVEGFFRVVRGKHDGSSFVTELEVVPV